MKNKKLKLIAVISAITICSSIGATTLETKAGGFISKISTSSSSSSGFWTRFKNSIPKVELDTSIFTNGWTKFKGLFTGSSKIKPRTSTQGNQNIGFDPTGDPNVDKRLGQLGPLVNDDPHMNGQKGRILGNGDNEPTYADLTLSGNPGSGVIIGGNGTETIYTEVRGSGNGGNPLPSYRFETGPDGVERIILGGGN